MKNFTFNVLDQATTIAVDLGKKAAKEAASTEAGGKISKNVYFVGAANIGKGAIHMIGGIYDGME